MSARSTPSRARRAGELAKRSIEKDGVWALELAVRVIDLTTFEAADAPGRVAAPCSKANRPEPSDAGIPSVAAVCVHPTLVAAAKRRLPGSGVHVASVATAFRGARARAPSSSTTHGARSRPAPTRSTW